jgi:hypothetical protein
VGYQRSTQATPHRQSTRTRLLHNRVGRSAIDSVAYVGVTVKNTQETTAPGLETCLVCGRSDVPHGSPDSRGRSSSASGSDDAAGHGEDPEPEPLGFPVADRPLGVEDEGLGPDEQVSSECDDLQPDIVHCIVGGWASPRAGVLQVPDALLLTGAVPVADIGRSLGPAQGPWCW